MAKEKQKRFLLRMDESLFAKLAQAATADGRSINAYIINILSKTATPGNWESRQLIGRTVPGTALDAKTGLVLVAGIYYRYLLEPREAPVADAEYTIIESNGNNFTFKKI